MNVSTRVVVAAMIGLVPFSTAGADVPMEWVTVGYPGNGPHCGTGLGPVAYVYEIGKYEVTVTQYAEFLNAVAATDTYGLYRSDWSYRGIARDGDVGSYTYEVAVAWANRPINFIDLGQAARFCNWMHHGKPVGPQGPGTTEDGAYVLDGATTDEALGLLTREPRAKVALASENEWHKAAFYDGPNDVYYPYAIGSHEAPSNDLIDPDPGNNATYNPGQGTATDDFTIGPPYFMTEVGAHENSASPMGTYDQAGNVSEWTEAGMYLIGMMRFAIRGGSFNSTTYPMYANQFTLLPPTSGDSSIGFRVVRLNAPTCGDGVYEPELGETCEDGNVIDGDGCDHDCFEEVCGNGVLQSELGEECDDGNTSDDDGCNGLCFLEVCGDGVVQSGIGELCDDGNIIEGDGCDSACATELCGNGVLQPHLGEQCDDGNLVGGDGCTSDCMRDDETDWVMIRHAGNEPMNELGYGAVDYEYAIGRYEVTMGEYADFLNAIAADDTYGLWSTDIGRPDFVWVLPREGAPGSYTYSIEPDWAYRPVNFTSWGTAARYCNWLHNGRPTGAQDLSTTESGAYYLNGAVDDASLMAVVREPDAWYALPTHNEWLKAALYDGDADVYYAYPTGSDELPSHLLVDPDPGNNATYNPGDGPAVPENYTIGAPYYRTIVGAHENSASPFGTFDQAGNVGEWTERIYRGERAALGGSYGQGELYLNTTGQLLDPSARRAWIGFRVVRLCNPVCGNGVVDCSEVCDDGNLVDGDGCTQTCTPEYCGDGIQHMGLGEECDDGNSVSGDGCSALCVVEGCGDGVLQELLGEQCDDGNQVNGDGCQGDCTLPCVCGDGILNEFAPCSEACDDGNLLDGDVCSSECALARFACSTSADCVIAFDDCCGWDHCGGEFGGYCDVPVPAMYADVCGTDFDRVPNGAVNLTDVLCTLNGFGEGNMANCPNADVAVTERLDCPRGNGIVNLTDILKVLDAFGAPSARGAVLLCDCPANP